MLDESSCEYHMHKLPEEKSFGEEIHGIHQIPSTNEIIHNLKEEGFDVIIVCRVHKKMEIIMIDMALILVQLASTEQNRNTINLTKLSHMLIRTEPQKDTNFI